MDMFSRRQVIQASVAGAAASLVGAAPATAGQGGAARTLLDLAGVHASPARLSEAVLIVVDAQEEYRKGRLPLHRVDPAILRVAELLKRARSARTPIIHIAQIGDPGDLFDRSGAGGQFFPEITPLAGETVIEKPLPNSFARTGLQEKLIAIGRKDLIVVGFMTHMCVSSTVRAAFDLDYRITVAADATATRALPATAGGADLTAAQIQASSLAALADYFATVVPAVAIPL